MGGSPGEFTKSLLLDADFDAGHFLTHLHSFCENTGPNILGEKKGIGFEISASLKPGGETWGDEALLDPELSNEFIPVILAIIVLIVLLKGGLELGGQFVPCALPLSEGLVGDK